jgi:hypothetical protein
MNAQRALAAVPRTPFSVVAQTWGEMDAVRAFNERMRAASAPSDFLLPDQPNNSHTLGVPPQAVEWTKFVVVDNEDEVRGGFLLMTQPGWLNGELVPVANYQGPLSEGIVDHRYGMVGMHMLRYVQKHWPFTFAVGMGGADRPLPRLLQAAGWHVRPVPFLFHVVRASRVLRELRVLQNRTAMRLAARAGALTGAGAIGAAAFQHRAWTSSFGAGGAQIERIERWDDWCDVLWKETRESASFTVVRDRATLECLYPLDDPKYLAYVVRVRGSVAGWAVAINTQMREHSHFGNLRVATVLDAVALPEATVPLVSQLRRLLAGDGADLIVTNQSHTHWIDAFKNAGFLGGPSNYLLAISPALSNAIGDRSARIHVTRGDGDGRIHLLK